MFHLGNSAEVNREQQADRLRQAEQARLVQEVLAARVRPALWKSVKARVSEIVDRRPAAGQAEANECYAFGEG